MRPFASVLSHTWGRKGWRWPARCMCACCARQP